MQSIYITLHVTPYNQDLYPWELLLKIPHYYRNLFSPRIYQNSSSLPEISKCRREHNLKAALGNASWIISCKRQTDSLTNNTSNAASLAEVDRDGGSVGCGTISKVPRWYLIQMNKKNYLCSQGNPRTRCHQGWLNFGGLSLTLGASPWFMDVTVSWSSCGFSMFIHDLSDFLFLWGNQSHWILGSPEDCVLTNYLLKDLTPTSAT